MFPRVYLALWRGEKRRSRLPSLLRFHRPVFNISSLLLLLDWHSSDPESLIATVDVRPHPQKASSPSLNPSPPVHRLAARTSASEPGQHLRTVRTASSAVLGELREGNERTDEMRREEREREEGGEEDHATRKAVRRWRGTRRTRWNVSYSRTNHRNEEADDSLDSCRFRKTARAQMSATIRGAEVARRWGGRKEGSGGGSSVY